MFLNDLAKWRAAHPNDPIYECARIGEKIHLVAHAGRKALRTNCGLDGDVNTQLLVFLIPAHLIMCKTCRPKGE